MAKRPPKLFVKFAEQQCSKPEASIHKCSFTILAKRNLHWAWSFLHVYCMTSIKIPKPQQINKVFRIFSRNYKKIPLEIFSNPYKILISTLLSSRTKDEVTLVVSKRLFLKAPDIEKLHRMNRSEIQKLIYPVGFYITKAKHLKNLAAIIKQDFNGTVPSSRNDLMILPGVGRKTTNLVLNRAFNKPAIAVDTHVHRISNLLGWVKTKTPQATEKELIKILPKKYWKDVNRLFVSVGRQYRSKKRLIKFLKDNLLV